MNQNQNPGQRFALTSKIRFRAIDDDGVLIHLDSGRVIVVNGVALRIIELLEDSPRSEADLAREIVSEYDVKKATALSDVRLFLDELKSEDVLFVE